MDLRQLHYVLEIMEAGTLKRAAERLHISQPALTKSLQRLEETLGVMLFERDARGMKPTVYAQHLSRFARTVTTGFQQSLQDLSALREGAMGVVTIATPPVLAASVVANAVVHLSSCYPRLKVSVLIEIEEIFTSLEAGRCDLAFAMRPAEKNRFPGLCEKILTDDELIVISRPGHRLADRPVIQPQDVVNEQWILPLPGNILRGRLERIFTEAEVPVPSARIECQAPDFIKKMVQQTDLLGWVPKLGCREELASKTISMSRFLASASQRKVGVFWREPHLSPAALLLSAALERECANNPPDLTIVREAKQRNQPKS